MELNAAAAGKPVPPGAVVLARSVRTSRLQPEVGKPKASSVQVAPAAYLDLQHGD
jgi:hypothetical protein